MLILLLFPGILLTHSPCGNTSVSLSLVLTYNLFHPFFIIALLLIKVSLENSNVGTITVVRPIHYMNRVKRGREIPVIAAASFDLTFLHPTGHRVYASSFSSDKSIIFYSESLMLRT